MSTTTKKRNNFIMALREMFGTNNESYETEVELPEDLRKTLADLKKAEDKIQQAIVSGKQSSNKAGFSNKINPETKAAMRQMYNEVIKDKEDNSRDER